MSSRTLITIAGALIPALASAQEHTHRPGMVHSPGMTMVSPAASPASAALSRPGQAAFGAIAEIVRLLQADSSTDWTRVDIEGLRQHLIDMDDVTLRAVVRTESVPGGARFTVRGEGRVTDAIRRMAKAHASMPGAESGLRATVEDIPGGARVTVVATDGADRTVATIRGLGFIGLLTAGDHHGPHHLAMARGTPPEAHTHDR